MRHESIIFTHALCHPFCGLTQGSPTPGPQTNTSLWPVRNQATQQEVSGRQASQASSAAPQHSPSLTLPPDPLLVLLPEPFPPASPWKNCLPRHCSLMPNRLGTAGLTYLPTADKRKPYVLHNSTLSPTCHSLENK